jgi:hypothetical protein
MSKHRTVFPKKAADRLSIRELVEAYAHCADRRDAKGQMSIYVRCFQPFNNLPFRRRMREG